MEKATETQVEHLKSGMITNLEYYSRSSAHRFFIKSYLECIETNTGGVLQKKEFLKISQNLQENTCATNSLFFNKVAGLSWSQVSDISPCREL